MTPMIPEGSYRAKAVALPNENGRPVFGRFGVTSKGSRYIEIVFRILEGEHHGQEYVWAGYFTPAARVRTMEALALLGLKDHDLEGLQMGTQQLANEVMVAIAHDEYKGRITPKVAFVNPLGGAVDVKALAEEMRVAMGGKSKAPAKPKSKLPKALEAKANDVFADDDIPF